MGVYRGVNGLNWQSAEGVTLRVYTQEKGAMIFFKNSHRDLLHIYYYSDWSCSLQK